MLRYSFHSDSLIHLQPSPTIDWEILLLLFTGGWWRQGQASQFPTNGELFGLSVTSSSHHHKCGGQEAADWWTQVRCWRLEGCGITVLGRHTEDGGGWAQLYTGTASPPHTLLHRRVLLTTARASLCLCYLHIEWSNRREAAVDI